jgi:hypothetical protein
MSSETGVAKGFPLGMSTTQADTINPDLLEWIQGNRQVQLSILSASAMLLRCFYTRTGTPQGFPPLRCVRMLLCY